jgi:hypothetical protein
LKRKNENLSQLQDLEIIKENRFLSEDDMVRSR